MASSSSMPSSSASTAQEIVEHKHTAPVWEHFEKVRIGTEFKAKCKHCSKLLTVSGNSTLARHIKSCLAKQAPEATQAQISAGGQIWTYDQMRQRELQMRNVIRRGLPLGHYDHEEETEYIHEGLQPKYQQVSRSTLKRDAFKSYMQAKQDLINYLETYDGRVSLTSDVWSSNIKAGVSYICITCHWIDSDSWNLNKRIICFEYFEYPHTGQAIYHVISKCIREFKIKDKILSISFDNASNNTVAIDYLKRDLRPILSGIFFHTRCVCHVLNLIVQDSLSYMEPYINKMRIMLKYIYTSKKRKQDFKKFVNAQGLKFLKPQFDMPIRWNSTYQMIKRAVRQKTQLMEFYSMCEVHNFQDSDWDVIENYMELLEVFYRSTTILSGVYYPTSSLVIENFVLITEKFKAYKKYEGWRPLIQIMEEIFLKYYKEMPAMFSCAAALNPLIGVDGVENLIEEINNNLNLSGTYQFYDNISVSKFNTDFTEFYNYYDQLYGSRPREESTQPKTKDILKNKILELAARKKQRTSSTLNELGLYTKTQFQDFMSSNEIENFDVLQWWKNKINIYPVMAFMARDLLTIQASTVASESAFSLSGRILTDRRSRLSDDTLEMCICYKDHLDAMKRRQHVASIEDSSSDVDDELGGLNLGTEDQA